MFYGQVAYHDFSGPVVELAQQEGLVKDLGSLNAMILRNHGLLVCGGTIAEAFFNIYWLECACRIQVDALAAGDVILPGEASLEASRQAFGRIAVRGRREWAAVRRELDRIDPSYQD
ncbi:aldolase II superfamily protein [compost metagenome]